jgi:TctA family transporter
LFEVGEVAVFGVIGAVFLALKFPVSPIVLGFVLGPMLEQNFRRSMLLERGDLGALVTRPICATFLSISALLILVQFVSFVRARIRAGQERRNDGKNSRETIRQDSLAEVREAVARHQGH